MTQGAKYEQNYKSIKAKMSDGTVIEGQINVISFARLSDYLKHATDKFITILSDESERGTKKTTIVNKDHIIWAETWG